MANYPAINSSRAQTKYNVSRANGRAVKHIVVHYTGTSASAENNITYFSGGNRNASADYFINKDGSIWQFNADPRNYYSWHCGDGGGKYGITNSQSIGIEVVSAGEEFTQAQKNALRDLVTALMSDYHVPASNVVRHYDASRKSCPAPYAGDNNAKWTALHKYITTEEDIVTPQDKQDIINGVVNAIKPTIAAEVWNYMIGSNGISGKDNAPAWQVLGWCHHDAYWAMKNAENGTVDAILGKQVKRKDTGANMSLGDQITWAVADAAGNAKKLNK